MKLIHNLVFLIGMSFALSEASISSPKSSLAKPAKIHQKKPVAFVPLTDQDQQDTRSIDTLKILRAGDSITTLLPSAIFMGFAALLVKLVKNIQDSGLQRSIGVLALFFTSVTVGYDNFIIGLGKLFFADTETNERKRSILKVLSYPRFTAHAVFVPFLFTTVAEIGKGVGITWLESSNIQLIMIIAATVVGVYSRVQFVRGDGIQLADPDEDVPNKALQRELVWFTYVSPSFANVLPAILLSLFSIVVGGFGLFGGEARKASIWMIFAGVASILGNMQENFIMRFTGNLAEICLLWGMQEAAKLVLPGIEGP